MKLNQHDTFVNGSASWFIRELEMIKLARDGWLIGM